MNNKDMYMHIVIKLSHNNDKYFYINSPGMHDRIIIIINCFNDFICLGNIWNM